MIANLSGLGYWLEMYAHAGVSIVVFTTAWPMGITGSIYPTATSDG